VNGRSWLRVVVLVWVMACCGEVVAGPYRLRYGRTMPRGEGYGSSRGSYVAVIGDRLFAGATWGYCGRFCDAGSSLRVYDLALGALERELHGVRAVASTRAHALLGYFDHVDVVDPETLAVARTVPAPNAAVPRLDLQGVVGDDMLVVGYDDRPERAGQQVVFRLSPESGAIVRRYDVPPTLEWAGAHVGARLAAVAHGGVVAISATAVTPTLKRFDALFVLGAEDGRLRWSKKLPGGSVAVTDRHVLRALPRPGEGVLLAFDVATGRLAHLLVTPVRGALVARDGVVAVGDTRHGPSAGSVSIFSESDWEPIDVLNPPSESLPFADSIALEGDLVVTGSLDGVARFDVFERDPATTTTTLRLCGGRCDDGDPCTTDACVDGACASTVLPGAAGRTCRLRQVRAAAGCAPRAQARRLGARLDGLIVLARRWGDGDAPPPARGVRRFGRRLRAYCQRVAALDDAGTLEPSCAASLADPCDDHVTAVQTH